MTQIAAVKDPDSATHFICDAVVAPKNTTHHLNAGRCAYCGRTDTQIREEAGLA